MSKYLERVSRKTSDKDLAAIYAEAHNALAKSDNGENEELKAEVAQLREMIKDRYMKEHQYMKDTDGNIVKSNE